MKNLKNIKFWLFDLDNTLYDGATKVFDQVDKKMSKFISEKLSVSIEEARKIQKNYFQEYNTTLNGMIKHHKIDADEFLEFAEKEDNSVVWSEEDSKLHTIGGLSNDKDKSFMKFINKLKFVIKGDQKIPSISAASIIAKVSRDKFITKLSKQFNGYGWDTNSGYGTKEHLRAIKKLGITKYHRKTFSSVSDFL